VPDKVGFIYQDEKKSSQDGLVVLLKEIAFAAKKISGSELWLFSSNPPEGSQEYVSYLEQIPALTHKRCVPESVATLEDGKTLVVDYKEGGEKRTERFHMIVIATQRKLSDSIKTVGEQLGLKLSQNVNASESSSPEQTAKSGVAVAGGITTR
jgi:hypothetical protein